MSREIKFRGWFPKAKLMTSEFEDNGIELYTHSADGSIAVSGQFEDETTNGEVGKRWTEDGVLMQYTGLKDMLNNEVFEGDVVAIYPEDQKHNGSEARFWIDTDLTLWGTEFDWQHISGYECSTHIMRLSEAGFLLNAKVIGNIYENPELLNAA